MGRFSDFLTRINPISGRWINERGYVVNAADELRKLTGTIDIFGQMQVAEYTPIIESKPLPGLSLIRDRVVGTASVVGGEIAIDGTSAPAEVYTRQFGRYLPGLVGLAGLGFRIENPAVGSYEVGYGGDEGNRFGLEVTNGEYFTFIESGGVRGYRKPRSEWIDPLDGTGPSGQSIDLARGNILRMPFGWYGYLSVVWAIAFPDATGDRVVVFDISGPRDDGVSIEQPDLPIFAEADGGVLYVGGRQFGVLGRYSPQFRVCSNDPVSASIGEALTPLLSYRVKNATRWQGVPVHLSGNTLTSSANGRYAIIIGGTLTGGEWGSIDGIDPDETALEINTGATAVSGGYRAFSDLIAAGRGNESGLTNAELPDLNIPKDQVVTLAAAAQSGTSDFRAVMRLREEW